MSIERGSGWSRLDWVAVMLVSLAAAAVRLVAIDRPLGFVFDEIFYAQNACRYVLATPECGIDELASRAHPPLGNWIIGLGIRLFGYDEFGWRVMAAVAGILTVALLYVLVRRLLHGTPPMAATAGAVAASGLLATDLLHLVSSRVGMLDAFVTLFVVAAVLFAVLDRDRLRRARWDRSPEGWLTRLALGRPWRLLAGVALGAAVAVKWSGAYVAFAIIPLVVAWEVTARQQLEHAPDAPRRKWREGLRPTLPGELPRTLVLLAVVPLLVYLAAYVGRIPGELIGPPWQEGTVWRGIWDHQDSMVSFHANVVGRHPYESPPWTWLLIKRPVAYHFLSEGGTYREILAIGNPVAWAGALVSTVVVLGSWARAGWSLMRPEAVLLAAILATYLPWVALSGARSQVFIWYLLPSLPFVFGAVGVLVARGWGTAVGRMTAAVFGAVVVALFLFFLPLATALPVSPDDWRARMWLTDCDRPGAPPLSLPDGEINEGPPPSGWCWI